MVGLSKVVTCFPSSRWFPSHRSRSRGGVVPGIRAEAVGIVRVEVEWQPQPKKSAGCSDTVMA